MGIITPSKMSTWEGTAVEGSPYTAQQIRVMKLERPNWTRFQDRMVKLTYPPETTFSLPTESHAPCPIIAWTKDRQRVLIITPAGEKRWMDSQK